jgi:TusA-related sulfurtransferase
MPHEVDARGLSCPQPVLMTLQAIQSAGNDDICIRVDNSTSFENVSRAATGKGWLIANVEQNDGEYRVMIHKGFA